MVKTIIFLTKLVVATVIALLFTSCNNFNLGNGIKGSGNTTTETRTVNQDFKKVEVSSGIEVVIEQSNNKSITVEIDDNLQKHIITKVENGVLIIESDESYNTDKSPVVTVKMPVIEGLASTSGSTIKSQNTLMTNNLNVKSSSGSEIEIMVEADNLTLESTSGSSISTSGKALKLETTSSSGSEINAEKLLANEVIAQATSGSSTEVFPILSLKAKASSGSSVDYHKEPKTISKEETSGGSVSKE